MSVYWQRRLLMARDGEPGAGGGSGTGTGTGGEGGQQGGGDGQGQQGQGDTKQPDPPKTYTQAEIDAAVAKATKKYGDYDALKAAKKELDDIKAASQSDVEKLTSRAETAERERDEARATLAERDAAALRARIAAEYKLSPDLADYLKGDTEAELKASAKTLAEKIAPPKAPDTDAGKGNSGGAEAGAGAGAAPAPAQPYRFQVPGEVKW